jgi:hypothetical protein
MEIIYLSTALKRKYTKGDIENTVLFPLAVFNMKDNIYAYIGWSLEGELIEVFCEQNGYLKVFHCMKAWKQFIDMIG